MDLAAASPLKGALTLVGFEEHLHKAIDKPTTNFRMRRIGPSRKKERFIMVLTEQHGLKQPLMVV